MFTSTVENYLKAILLRSDTSGDGMVSMGALAGALDVVPGTVTTMVKAMAGQGLLEHQSRQGVRLTAQGRKVALGVLRKHRLVETFLVQTLKMDWADVHEEAEALEHAISDRVLAKIDAFLGYPATDPHGDPIPDAKGRLDEEIKATLANCELKETLLVARITDQSAAFLEFIQQQGLKPGAKVKVLTRDITGGILRCQLRPGVEVALGLPEAAKIEVQAA